MCCDSCQVKEEEVWKVWIDQLGIVIGDLIGSLEAVQGYNDVVVGIVTPLLAWEVFLMRVIFLG